MPKSKYPNQLDTSVEIPAVRDNILEIGSDAINSLRSAIFKIEKVLGINPQGTAGNTVASRLDKALDGNGNIKSEALNKSNILTGPIIDADVSKVAAIQESKLKLDFPTTLLQDEISILNSTIEQILEEIEQLSVTLSLHIDTSSINRHPSTAISVKEAGTTPSDIAFDTLSNSDVQSTFEDLVNSHIKYTGDSISADNNSHSAEQIYFDKTEVDTIVFSDDTQGAIEDLAEAALNSQIDHQDKMHSNGILKSGVIDTASKLNVGNILAEDISVSFSKALGVGGELSTITIDDTIELEDFELEKSDIITLSDPTDTSLLFSGDYEIESFVESSGAILSITVYGNLAGDSTSQTTARISKNIKKNTNPTSLLSTVREDPGLTSASSLQVCNPNSVKVISSGIRPLEITATNRFVDVTIDNNSAVTLDLFDSNFSRQNIDSVVSKINEQCADNSFDFSAYRVDYEAKSPEFALAHNIPDDSQETHTITISRSTDNGIDAAGFSSVEDQEILSEYGTNYFINGRSYEGLESKIDVTGLTFVSSSNIITNSSSAINFLELDIKSQDLLTITDAVNSLDNGTYVVNDVSDTQIILDSSQLPTGFTGSSQETTRFRIFRNIASFGQLVFDEVNSNFGAVLGDIFLNEDRKVFVDKRFEYSVEILGSNSLITLVDFNGDVANKQYQLNISSNTNSVTLSLNVGEDVEVRGENTDVRVGSGDDDTVLKFFIPSVSELNSRVISNGSDIVLTLFGFEGANQDSNLFISRTSFSNFNGRIDAGTGAARFLPLLNKGNIGTNEITEEAKQVLSRQSVDDLRFNGVVRGLNISNVTTTNDLYTFDISRGVCYVKGKRLEIPEYLVYVTDIDSTAIDKIFIAIDELGALRVQKATPDCKSPFNDQEVCLLHSLEFDNTTIFDIDLRLFINDLDLKLLNSITVSPSKNMGHFSEFGKAIKYAKRFSELFPNSSIPSIHLKSGDHTVTTIFDNSSITYSEWNAQTTSVKNIELYDGLINAGLVIDFPVSIIGEGDTSKLIFRNQYIFSDVTYNYRGELAVAGSGFTSYTSPLDKLSDGFVTFKNFRMDNCKLAFLDFNLDDGANDQMVGSLVENITFDFDNFVSNPFDNSIGSKSIRILEIDDTATDKGNITISNCNFISCGINISSPLTLKNINIINNRLMNVGSSSTIDFLDRNILTFDLATSGSNITILGNHSTSTFFDEDDSNAPDMVSGTPSTGWGERINRRLYVGYNITNGGTYNYQNAQARVKHVFMDQVSDPAMGAIGVNAASFGNAVIDGVGWKTVEFTNAGVGTEFARFRLDLYPGEILVAVLVYSSALASGSASFSKYNVAVRSHDLYGNQTVEMSSTTGSQVINGDMSESTVVTPSIEGSAGKFHWIQVVRNDTTGFLEDLHYISYLISANTVEKMTGYGT